jgi:hypothetical protein
VLSFTETTTISGDLAVVWETATDVLSYPSWDPHVEATRFEGPFQEGNGGWTKPAGAPGGDFKLTSIVPEQSWTTESPMPLGKMLIVNSYEQVAPGKVSITRDFEIHGPFAPVFKKFWMSKMREDVHRSFAALEEEAGRRAAASA